MRLRRCQEDIYDDNSAGIFTSASSLPLLRPQRQQGAGAMATRSASIRSMADPQGIGESSRAEPVIAGLRSVFERVIFCKWLLPDMVAGRILQRSEGAKIPRNSGEEGN